MSIKIVECPRDAMQGIHEWIPTETKIAYLNGLLRVGFDTLDFGSFVSPKSIPQMRDTAAVLRGLDLSVSKTQLLAIVANERGAQEACAFDEIGVLGYPFSVSETFQIRNTNATIAQSLERVAAIKKLCDTHKKQLVIYVSMGFGNPYGDPWNVDIVQFWVDELADMGIKILSLSDTIGSSTPESISYLFKNLIPPYPDVEFGAHLHTQPHNWREKVEAAYANGCQRFDAALRGFGGCPMAKDDLTGNMPTEHLLTFLDEKQVAHGLNHTAFAECMGMTNAVFKI
jgi:hydroxymethylglutaryl-CoA lyase